MLYMYTKLLITCAHNMNSLRFHVLYLINNHTLTSTTITHQLHQQSHTNFINNYTLNSSTITHALQQMFGFIIQTYTYYEST